MFDDWFASLTYTTMLSFGRAPLGQNRTHDAIVSLLSSVGAYQCIVPIFGNFRSKFSIVQ